MSTCKYGVLTFSHLCIYHTKKKTESKHRTTHKNTKFMDEFADNAVRVWREGFLQSLD